MADAQIFRQPLCLVHSGPDGKMAVNTQVLDQLKSLDKEVVVVSMAGPYRTGKSHLMNKLAGQEEGLSLGSTVQSKTKGIWIWVRIHPMQADKYLVLLDTEGIGDVAKGDESHDHQILCLIVLLSSTLIYNVMGAIGNQALMKLHFLTELSKYIHVLSNSGVGSKSNDSNFDFPDFVCAIHDFGITLGIDGREVTADKYLEHSLTMKEGTLLPEVEKCNKIRSCIRRYFKKKKCFTFARPMPGKCRDLDDVADDKLVPEFLKETQAFLNFIFRESRVKEVGGERLSGRNLGSLVEVYVEQMKTVVPYVENAVDTMARLENSKAKDSGVPRCFRQGTDNRGQLQVQHPTSMQSLCGMTRHSKDICRETSQTTLKQPIKENLKAGKNTRSDGFRPYKNDSRDFGQTYATKAGPIGVKSKQTEEDAILKADEKLMVKQAKKRQEGSPAGMTDADIFRQPLCLVDSGPDGKMAVNTRVLDQLKSLDKEVVVVSIAGRYRTGKSYLMNKLAGQNKGFALGSTVQSKTKGIWIWVRNHPMQADKYLVLIDTEGLGDVEKGDENHDNQILCLSILLSSTVVYNVLGVIDNDAMVKLHFITELSKHIQVRSNNRDGSKSDDSNFDFYFPDFVYAIRDFELNLVIDGREITADGYLDHSLTMKKGTSKEVENFNKIRSCIRRYFKKRKCFTFPRPIDGRCTDLDDATDDMLIPEFLKETQAFLNFIFRESPVKEAGGKRLSGRMLGSLVEVYVEQMKTGVPYVENAVETMAKLENSKAKDEASALYYNLMLESLKMPVDDDAEFSRCHNTCLKRAIDLFLSKAVSDNNHTFQRQMNEDIENKYSELVQTNEDICRKTCQTALKQLYEPIKENLKAGKYTRSGGFRRYKNDIKDFEENYKLKIGRIGVKMRHVLLEFLHSKQTEEDAILKADEMVTEAEKQQEAERQKANEAQRLQEEAERAVNLQAQQLLEHERAHAENISRLEKQMREQYEAAQKHHEEVLNHRLKEQQRLLEEGFKKDADQMTARIDELQRQNESDEKAQKRREEEFASLLKEQKEQQRLLEEGFKRDAEQMRAKIDELQCQKEIDERAHKEREEKIADLLKQHNRLLEEGFKRDADQMRARIDELQRQKEIAQKSREEEIASRLKELEETNRQNEQAINQMRNQYQNQKKKDKKKGCPLQ